MSRPEYIQSPIGWRAWCSICKRTVFRWHRHTGIVLAEPEPGDTLTPVERHVAEMVYTTGLSVVGGSMGVTDAKTGEPIISSEAWKSAYSELRAVAKVLGYSDARVERDLAAESQRFEARRRAHP